MKIVVDLQACQTPGSATRGIGRYSFSLAEAMLEVGNGHEFILVGNDAFPDTMLEIRRRFQDLVEPSRIKTFTSLSPSSANNPSNHFRRAASELLREKFISDLRPDFVHISSLFEGAHDDAITSVGGFQSQGLSAVTLYDLIPLLKQHLYLTDMQIKRWYLNKVGMLQRADLLLAISNATRTETLEALGLEEQKVVNISSAADSVFRPTEYSDVQIDDVLRKHKLSKTFIMYTGGIDGRKNIESLIRAYAKMPLHLRSKYHLAIVCSISPTDRARLIELGRSHGIKDGSLVLTGYVSEADLVVLYNLCSLFVFPSLHEGFGLPVLEAMACGAPSIGSNNSSIPEVIGRADALFDPYEETSITAKMIEVLNNPGFADALRQHSRQRATTFTWAQSAKRAIDAMEEASKRRAEIRNYRAMAPAKPTLAVLSPLPPAKSGIADYTAKLLPYLHTYYNIEVVSDRPIVDDWIWANCNIVSPAEFEMRDDLKVYDRILYQLGNSDFHEYMFDLLETRPGTVVLHDYFLSGIESWREHHYGKRHHFVDQLTRAHGYKALVEHMREETENYTLWKYPVNKHVVDNAYGIIVHSDYSLSALKSEYGIFGPESARKVPIAQAGCKPDRASARKHLGLRDDDFIICCFGFLGETKLNHVSAEGFLNSSLAKRDDCKLVFVGEGSGAYQESLLRLIEASPERDRVFITGFASAEDYAAYLSAADVALQLRSKSRGETSAAILDCAAHEVAIIANSHGTFAELDPGAVIMLPNEVAPRDVSAALETLYSDRGALAAYTNCFSQILRNEHAPPLVAQKYFAAIEHFWSQNALYKERLIPEALRRTQYYSAASSGDVTAIVQASVVNRIRTGKHNLFVDVSELIRKDWGSGIQAVVKSILWSLVANYSEQYNVLPVYFEEADGSGGYFSAREFSARFFGGVSIPLTDQKIEPAGGDIFLGIDLDYFGPILNKDRGVYSRWRARGVGVFFFVYDILPLSNPEFFQGDSYTAFYRWLTAVCESADGLICISESVERELRVWLEGVDLSRSTTLGLGHFHLGTDIRSFGDHSKNLALSAVSGLDSLDQTLPTLLMVGTIEPRKGHSDVLNAAALLWQRGVRFNLVVVGKRGWLCDDIARQMEALVQEGRNLFWLQSVGEEISRVYAMSDGLIAASYAEGFGLPLIEAAAVGLPLFARDIPVFREVAKNGATFFTSECADISNELQRWIAEIIQGTVVSSSSVVAQTWNAATDQLMRRVEDRNWPIGWSRSKEFWKFRAMDEKLQCPVGVRKRGRIDSDGTDGVLLYGPYLALPSGIYEVKLLGALESTDSSSVLIQITANRGNDIIASEELSGKVRTDELIHAFPRMLLAENVTDLEIRVDIKGKPEISISGIEIRRLAS
ncbi:glycosyltransferase [Neorhizobium sp. DAR64872/K0K18]|uniref:glycosyltransferase n=1 Tax=Neorhizobium sp. DAR64872/K0K18 TaxID=3421958 RepID=UPI003D28D985